MGIMTLTAWAMAMAAQAAAPPFIQFGQRFDDYAVLASSVSTCAGMGYATDADIAAEIGNRLVEDAVRSGIDLAQARAMAMEAVSREGENLQFLLSRVDEEDLATVDAHIDFWLARCDALAADKRWGGAIVPLARGD